MGTGPSFMHSVMAIDCCEIIEIARLVDYAALMWPSIRPIRASVEATCASNPRIPAEVIHLGAYAELYMRGWLCNLRWSSSDFGQSDCASIFYLRFVCDYCSNAITSMR
jgi:hypothetical protein